MIPETRRNQILTILKQKGYCSVDYLAKKIYVSVPTIRRDLSQLEKDGLIKRMHGGASYLSGKTPLLPFELRSKSMFEEKLRIGEAAARLINEYDSIFLDSSSTCLCLAKSMDQSKKINVLTNSIVIATTLADAKNINVELTGGQFDSLSLSLHGKETEAYIQTRYAKYCFLTVNSIDSNFGMSHPNEHDIPVKKAFARNAEKAVLLVDSSRMNRKDYYKVFDFTDIDILITDKNMDETMMKMCEENKIQVIIAK